MVQVRGRFAEEGVQFADHVRLVVEAGVEGQVGPRTTPDGTEAVYEPANTLDAGE
jgi:formylmethanofuran:tetrahydromethanopterin formyltransferase